MKTLNIPVSLSLGDSGLLLAFEHPRVAVKPSHESLTADLDLKEDEGVVFEATDFVAHGTTYRVRATATMPTGENIEWERHPSGCRSPRADGAANLSVMFSAVPASTSAAKSTTHTTIIIKKGKPFPLEE